MNLLKIFFFTTLLIANNNANAESVYKWIDEDGQVNYGSRPDDKKIAEEVEIKNRYIDSGNSTRPLSATQRANKLKRFVNSVDAENKALAEEKKKKQEQEELNLTRCNASRDQLKRAKAASALYDLDEKGNRILLNKKQYEQAMQQARARVEKWCN